MAKAPIKKKKKDIRISDGIFHVKTTRNNTVITLTNQKGDCIVNAGTGTKGFKGAKKSTPFAAEVLMKDILNEAKEYGLERAGLIFKGTGISREGIFKAINETGLVELDYIREATPLQFGGCKRKRPKRN